MDQILCKLRRDAGRSVCGTAHRVGQAVVPLIAGPFTKSLQSPECDPVPPQVWSLAMHLPGNRSKLARS